MIGNSRIVMISTISPYLFSKDETINTLLFANRAKNIQTIVKKNKTMRYQINKYDEIISNLNNELENLRHNLSIKKYNQHLLRGGIDYSKNNFNSKIDKIRREIITHFNDEIKIKNEIIDIQKNIDMLIEKYHEKEFLLSKCLNYNNNMFNEKIIRYDLNKINEQINFQKQLIINKENFYNELMKKREYFKNEINKISINNTNNNNNFNNLQYLYYSFVFEVKKIENEFQNLVDQSKIKHEFNNKKNEIENKHKKFESENDIRKKKIFNINKSFNFLLLFKIMTILIQIIFSFQ